MQQTKWLLIKKKGFISKKVEYVFGFFIWILAIWGSLKALIYAMLSISSWSFSEFNRKLKLLTYLDLNCLSFRYICYLY